MKGVFEVSDTQKPTPSKEMVEVTRELITSKPKGRLIFNPISGQMEWKSLGMWMAHNKDEMNPSNDEIIHPGIKLSDVNAKILKDDLKEFIKKIQEILEISRGTLEDTLGISTGYLSVIISKVSSGKIRIRTLYKNLESWRLQILEELKIKEREGLARQRFYNLYETFSNKVLKQMRRIYRQQYNYYKNIANKKRFVLITTFREFFNEIIETGIQPNKFQAEVWNGKQDQEPIRVTFQLMKSKPFSHYLDIPRSDQTSYYQLIDAAATLGYEIKYPRSKSEWDTMLKNRPKGTAPVQVKVTAICPEHGEFITDAQRLNTKIRCKLCYYDFKVISLSEIKKRGKPYGLILDKSMTKSVISYRRENQLRLDWRCDKHHNIIIKAHPFKSDLERAYCEICSKGRITEERTIRFMLNRMFRTDQFGNSPKILQTVDRLKFENVVQNQRVKDFMTSHGISYDGYRKSHLDILAEVLVIDGVNNGEGLLVSVEPWGPQHEDKSHVWYNERICYYDELKQILYEEGFIDILVVVKLWEIQSHGYQDFIITELKRQVKEKFGIEIDLDFPAFLWVNLINNLKKGSDFQSLDNWI